MNDARNIFRSRASRTAVIALLLYEALFLNVLVPVHTRGAITLGDGQGASCCASHESRPSPKHAPSEKDRQNCAVCHFAARMSTPLVVCFKLPELGLVQLLPFPPPAVPNASATFVAYLGRGPPAVV